MPLAANGGGAKHGPLPNGHAWLYAAVIEQVGAAPQSDRLARALRTAAVHRNSGAEDAIVLNRHAIVLHDVKIVDLNAAADVDAEGSVHAREHFRPDKRVERVVKSAAPDRLRVQPRQQSVGVPAPRALLGAAAARGKLSDDQLLLKERGEEEASRVAVREQNWCRRPEAPTGEGGPEALEGEHHWQEGQRVQLEQPRHTNKQPQPRLRGRRTAQRDVRLPPRSPLAALPLPLPGPPPLPRPP
eukprot:CAMPEP_0202798458 /NCGR_PEP_ID=MMETSP1388-20130828/96290_1 /ASSEMBLY_ACC=CAM_ASM_000864 /TAXON_ID=37098 /ORGANISM="Isochrysis sp, Strain CCMP1244" /LENGTH=242 /DNA_ID=CAMNT_0049468387 /DNA_START=275 /DNA_END=1001 /DNA_ORIENTATION=-